VPIRTIEQAGAYIASTHIVGAHIEGTHIEGTQKTPFFCVHGGTGNVASFPKLARGLGQDQPFYGLQWDGLRELKGTTTIAAMASRYLIDVRSVQPRGPYLLGGQCIGGLIAQEMARQLLAQGEQVSLVVMYDSPNMQSLAYVPQSSAEKAKVALYLAKVKGERGARALLHGVRTAATIGDRVSAATSVVKTKAWRDPAVKPRGFGELVADVLVDAVLSHRVQPPTAPTLYFASGLAAGHKIGLSGVWTDNSLGFAEFAGPNFRIVRAGGGHDHMLYSEDAINAVRQALEQFHQGTLPLARQRTIF
jgi:thioesterase domain-containing protein